MSPTSLLYKVTLQRSTIGLPEKTRQYARSIGLTKLQRTVLLPVSPKSADTILKLKELVHVEHVVLPRGITSSQALANMKVARKPFPGYKIVGSALQKTW